MQLFGFRTLGCIGGSDDARCGYAFGHLQQLKAERPHLVADEEFQRIRSGSENWHDLAVIDWFFVEQF